MTFKLAAVSTALCVNLALAVASPGAAGAEAPSEVEAVTEISGSKVCPAGQDVRITVWVDYSQVVQGFWPANSSTSADARFTTSVVTFVTGAQSTSWRVTGSSLSQASDYCA